MTPAPGRFPPSPAPSAETLVQVADALVWPLFVLKADGTLLHANRAAQQILRRGEPLRLAAGHRVQLADAGRQAAFSAALAAAAGSHAQQLLHWPRPASKPRHGGAAAFMATLVALATVEGASTSGAEVRSKNASRKASRSAATGVSVLLALAADGGQPLDTRAFADLHGLSRAEARVLQRLALGDNSTRAAAALGLAPATVRSQTASMRRKTGHASVAELMRAVVAVPPLAASAAA